MNRIDKKFAELRKLKKKAFIAFLTSGYPSLDKTYSLVLELASRGVDIIELGVPFSDPLADGAAIQNASKIALFSKVNINKIFACVRKIRRRSQIPLILMTYYNPILHYGESLFLSTAQAVGVDGVIIPDLPPEESGPLLKNANKIKLDLIPFIAPTTPFKRMRMIAKIARGFIYYVSVSGVTGARKNLPADMPRNLKFIKKITTKPVCIGFGISTPNQARCVSMLGDRVIIGSAIVNKITQTLRNKDFVKNVGNYVSYLIKGAR
jgi:tryptophan synthase alpha chain